MSNKQNILLSYPRCGNHLVRFFIELLTEIPTFGCIGNKRDVEIYKNIFPEKVPFNIKNHDKTQCFHKYHFIQQHVSPNMLILILRNPKEVLLRHNNFKLNITNSWDSFEVYFNNIEFFNKFKGKKLLLYYEDILSDKIQFINDLCYFLNVYNYEKKKFVLENIDKLYSLSSKGKNRDWGGVKSNNNLNFYYKQIPNSIKPTFDKYIDNKKKKYLFLKEKYDL